MFQLKKLSRDGIPRALAKAEQYRLLNEPHQAESICRDVLATDEKNASALVTLLLALTDQFSARAQLGVREAQEVLARLGDEYSRAYYAGIICERWAKARLSDAVQHAGAIYDWVHDAMGWYEKAARLAPPSNEDAILRFNACVRLLEENPSLQPHAEADAGDTSYGDDSPRR